VNFIREHHLKSLLQSRVN